MSGRSARRGKAVLRKSLPEQFYSSKAQLLAWDCCALEERNPQDWKFKILKQQMQEKELKTKFNMNKDINRDRR